MKLFLVTYERLSNSDYDDCYEHGEVGIYTDFMQAVKEGREYCKKRSVAHTHYTSTVKEFILNTTKVYA